MKHLIVKHIGPLDQIDIELKKVNVIIGPQSSGKSCVLKLACYCTWVEKRIELTQKPEYFQKENVFINELVRFHKLKGYIKPDTYVEYESDYMHFSYDHSNQKFQFNWKDARWEYTRSKVTYIPAERNMVTVIPNWFDVKLADDNIRDFMSDWETARKATLNQLDVLNLGIAYHYEESSHADKVRIENGEELDFTNTSSGLQSLIPLYVHLNYLNKLQYEQEKSESVKSGLENLLLLTIIYKELFEQETKKVIASGKSPERVYFNLTNDSSEQVGILFANQASANRCKEILSNYTSNHFCDIFLEEPEENLFPPTQTQLINWLLEITEGPHASNLSIATHSPYVLTSLLEKQDIDLGLFFTGIKEGKLSVKTATEVDMQEIYDYGVDAFFNLETFAK